MEQTEDRSVQGRIVFITGAGSGIGRAAALLFAREGARVVLTDVNPAGIEEAAAEIAAAGGQALALELDVARKADIEAVIAKAVAHFGGLDFVINNAGVALGGDVDDARYDDLWQFQFDVLLRAHHRIIAAALPHLRRSTCPRIVNVASTEALGATQHNSIYVAAKHGVAGLTRALAVDLGRENITVNAICPGPIVTGLTEQIPEENRATFARRKTALRRYGQPNEVAHMMLNLCLPSSSFITGAIIPVDGGMSARNA